MAIYSQPYRPTDNLFLDLPGCPRDTLFQILSYLPIQIYYQWLNSLAAEFFDKQVVRSGRQFPMDQPQWLMTRIFGNTFQLAIKTSGLTQITASLCASVTSILRRSEYEAGEDNHLIFQSEFPVSGKKTDRINRTDGNNSKGCPPTGRKGN